jgi:DNA-binding transcriptional MerR regulator
MVKIYSSDELAELTGISKRNIHYYSQIGKIPKSEKVNNRNVYTDKHLEALLAIGEVKKTEEVLRGIKNQITSLDDQTMKHLTNQSSYVTSDYLMTYETRPINEDLSISFSNRVSEEKRSWLIDEIQKLWNKKEEK